MVCIRIEAIELRRLEDRHMNDYDSDRLGLNFRVSAA